jgi:LPXTG-site transpeptidase (sortase) family protein
MKSQHIPRVVFGLFMLVALNIGVTVPVGAADNASSAIAGGNLIPVQPSMLKADGTLNLSNGAIGGALDLRGWDVTLDPKRGPVFSPAALPVNTWSAFTDNGVWAPVLALAVIGNDLYVGGILFQTYDGATTGLNHIAKYNTITNTWSTLTDNGLDDYVYALAVIGNNLYVGGLFTQTSGGATTGLNHIAKYNTLTDTWSALMDNGLDNGVHALAVIGNYLYVGGDFAQTFGSVTTGLNNIAKYNTLTNTWSALTDNGLDDIYVDALVVIGNNLYVGGMFAQTFGGATTGLNNIAKYDTLTSTWSALTDNGLSFGHVGALAAIGNDLYVGGGYFTQTYGGATTGLNNIARYNTLTNTWSALTDNGLNYIVYALTVIGNDLYVGGLFTQTFGGVTTNLNYIARYNTHTNTWSALTENGMNTHVYALAVIGNNLYVGGQFTQTIDNTTKGLNHIARYTVTYSGNTTTSSSLPKTGFAPNRFTSLPPQPANLTYSNLGSIWLEIPSQNIKTNIVGIPKSDNNWDVKWLGWDAGWLNSTAFPTWEGNSVITGHITDSNGLPGPFANIKDLKYGEQIIVHLYDQQYIFEIRNKRLVRPESTAFAFEHLEDHPYLTLITCQSYDSATDSYRLRRVIRAVLISVK